MVTNSTSAVSRYAGANIPIAKVFVESQQPMRQIDDFDEEFSTEFATDNSDVAPHIQVGEEPVDFSKKQPEQSAADYLKEVLAEKSLCSGLDQDEVKSLCRLVCNNLTNDGVMGRALYHLGETTHEKKGQLKLNDPTSWIRITPTEEGFLVHKTVVAATISVTGKDGKLENEGYHDGAAAKIDFRVYFHYSQSNAATHALKTLLGVETSAKYLGGAYPVSLDVETRSADYRESITSHKATIWHFLANFFAQLFDAPRSYLSTASSAAYKEMDETRHPQIPLSAGGTSRSTLLLNDKHVQIAPIHADALIACGLSPDAYSLADQKSRASDLDKLRTRNEQKRSTLELCEDAQKKINEIFDKALESDPDFQHEIKKLKGLEEKKKRDRVGTGPGAFSEQEFKETILGLPSAKGRSEADITTYMEKIKDEAGDGCGMKMIYDCIRRAGPISHPSGGKDSAASTSHETHVSNLVVNLDKKIRSLEEDVNDTGNDDIKEQADKVAKMENKIRLDTNLTRPVKQAEKVLERLKKELHNKTRLFDLEFSRRREADSDCAMRALVDSLAPQAHVAELKRVRLDGNGHSQIPHTPAAMLMYAMRRADNALQSLDVTARNASAEARHEQLETAAQAIVKTMANETDKRVLYNEVITAVAISFRADTVASREHNVRHCEVSEICKSNFANGQNLLKLFANALDAAQYKKDTDDLMKLQRLEYNHDPKDRDARDVLRKKFGSLEPPPGSVASMAQLM
ncbi:hypothetical protein [Paraburkholderia agricolaris]|uniref:hypothetical protein n=1 Tax=Paraburkholderia agricolaris TaxID=2152888 RepID=UPI0012928FF7|nr:hypothetical protein [Paraburkholderia agricolaris]